MEATPTKTASRLSPLVHTVSWRPGRRSQPGIANAGAIKTGVREFKLG